ncbi:glycosyltransferase [Bacillus sp. Bva_UNVM-123]|uniref:glycosyltransferase n=1 Tax=Bacillus sp. Bva_UNVM-123 TaxID=2829798 RepID=UPI00391F60EC
MKKIAMLSDHPDGSNPRIWRTAITMAELGYEVNLFCQKEPHEQEYEYKDGVHVKRVFDYKLGTTVLIDKYLMAHFHLYDAINHENSNFDVFHCHDPETWPIGYTLAKLQNAKWIADSHEFFLDYIEKKYYGDDIVKYETTVLLSKNRGSYFRYADGVIAVSEETLGALSSEYQLNCPRTVIFNTRFETDIIKINKQILRNKLGLEENIKYMVFAGNVMPDRGIENIINLVNIMPKNYRLIIIGDGLSSNAVTNDQLKTNKIIFLGRQEYQTLIKYIHASDAYFYFPEHYGENLMKNYLYTIPNKLFDAIFSRIPFFTFDGFAFSKYVKQYNIGAVYPIGMRQEEIANDIVKKIENNFFKDEHFYKAEDFYSWRNQKNKLKNLYYSVLEG